MKRKLLIAALALCLAAVIACGSLAYFTASHEAVNKFMTAKYDPEDPNKPEELFGIVVTETKEGGEQGETTKEGNTYEDILPGDSFKKDPVITNTGAYDEYVRVLVTFDKVAEWAKVALPGGDGSVKITYDKLFETLVSGYNSEAWTMVAPKEEDVKDNKITYVFYLKNALPAKDASKPGANSVALFTGVTIPETVDLTTIGELNPFTISVAAQAIQAKNTGASAQEAFTNYWN